MLIILKNNWGKICIFICVLIIFIEIPLILADKLNMFSLLVFGIMIIFSGIRGAEEMMRWDSPIVIGFGVVFMLYGLISMAPAGISLIFWIASIL
jgi:hypothetical protein